MGQYFSPAIIDSNRHYAIHLRGASKLTESGRLFNIGMYVVMNELERLTETKPVKYIHLGDDSSEYQKFDLCADSTDHLNTQQQMLKTVVYPRGVVDAEKLESLHEDMLRFHIYNHTKREKVSLQDFYNQGHNGEDEDESPKRAFHPLALLCCTQAGGYCFEYLFAGTDLSNGGQWLNDDISVSKNDFDGFTNITKTLRVTQSKESYQYLVQPRFSVNETFNDYAQF